LLLLLLSYSTTSLDYDGITNESCEKDESEEDIDEGLHLVLVAVPVDRPGRLSLSVRRRFLKSLFCLFCLFFWSEFTSQRKKSFKKERWSQRMHGLLYPLELEYSTFM